MSEEYWAKRFGKRRDTRQPQQPEATEPVADGPEPGTTSAECDRVYGVMDRETWRTHAEIAALIPEMTPEAVAMSLAILGTRGRIVGVRVESKPPTLYVIPTRQGEHE